MALCSCGHDNDYDLVMMQYFLEEGGGGGGGGGRHRPFHLHAASVCRSVCIFPPPPLMFE